MSDDTTRPGSGADLSRRIERLEARTEDQAAALARLEAKQDHADELSKYRFELQKEQSERQGAKLDAFMARIEGMIDGTIQTSQTREAAEEVADYRKWRREVDADRSRLATLGRLGVLLVTSNLLAWGAAIYALLHP